ncbi:MAG: hypothetical protein PVG02_03100 [Anaerolineales bacterium]|jgi:hypothetical protein
MQFPEVSGKNLDREIRTYPNDFEGKLNLVFIAFQQWQQTSINTWLPFAATLEAERDDLTYYEFPTIQSMNRIFRTFINEGMRAGIPDPKSRERTITLYLDKEPFRAALDMPDENRIYVLLIRQDGEVLWRTRGEYSAQREQSLRAAIQAAGA